ncbi:protein ALP1-like [Cornus florida]|uniref:protein ALP1-like n=1 Tax=Cornus florida TaxID=4283 RepID=UPI00289ABEFE|nr:protein ALP1-like [Cornus florida]XP_059652903.1 protein ALP1-like [Cornus florida]XP_059652904.1 protein ALP1-like [Cornus florida]
MDYRALTALLSSLISQLVLLLLLIFPSSDPLTISNSSLYENLIPLLHHFLSTSEIVTSLSLLSISRKRKRTHQPEVDSKDSEEELEPGLGQLSRLNSAIPQNPDSFKLCFRMSSSTFEWLSGLLEPLLDCRDPVGSPLSLTAESRLGIGLFRLSSGADYQEISGRFGVSEPITKFCVKQLCRVLCTNFRFWVGFPSPQELESVSAAFETLTGLPNCCGIIDCTRFRIVRNSVHESSSEDKFSEESIAAQIVVDSSSRILSIVAGFHGDKGDSRVLKSSTLYKDVEGGGLLNSPPMYIEGVAIPQYLVGDGGYPLLPWLLVPFVDPMPESFEDKFNSAHHLMRLPALRTIASLKNWGVLSKPMEEEFKTAVAYIGACSILHNVLLMREDYSALCDELGDYSLHDQSSQYYGATEDSIERNASVIRNALATRAKEFIKSDHTLDSSSSVQLQLN